MQNLCSRCASLPHETACRGDHRHGAIPVALHPKNTSTTPLARRRIPPAPGRPRYRATRGHRTTRQINKIDSLPALAHGQLAGGFYTAARRRHHRGLVAGQGYRRGDHHRHRGYQREQREFTGVQRLVEHTDP